MDPVSTTIRADVVRFTKQAAALGLIPNTQGNLSARDPSTGLIAITPHDYPYDGMTPDDLVIVDVHGQVVEGRHEPSSEAAVHCIVYREYPDVQGIAHTEPIYTNCFGALGMPIQPVLVSLVVDVGGVVPIMPFAPSGSADFGQRMLEVMGDCKAVVWGNHGLLTVGQTIEQAFRRSVTVETVAQVYHLTLLHGQPQLVTPESLHGGIA